LGDISEHFGRPSKRFWSQYGIVDVVTMVSEVADHQDILRSLGKTVLIKILVKKTVTQLERDKRKPAGEIQDELNNQARQ
jgi:hypothetical protein